LCFNAIPENFNWYHSHITSVILYSSQGFTCVCITTAINHILSPALLSLRQVPPTPAPRSLGNGDIIKPMEAGCTPPQPLMTHYPVLTHTITSHTHIRTHYYIHTVTCQFSRGYTNTRSSLKCVSKTCVRSDGYLGLGDTMKASLFPII